jgi:hypothetical protein
MSAMHSLDAPAAASDHAAILAAQAQHCEECLGAGGWYRYEPALEQASGVLYLSCLHCRGSGRMAFSVSGVLRGA